MSTFVQSVLRDSPDSSEIIKSASNLWSSLMRKPADCNYSEEIAARRLRQIRDECYALGVFVSFAFDNKKLVPDYDNQKKYIALALKSISRIGSDKYKESVWGDLFSPEKLGKLATSYQESKDFNSDDSRLRCVLAKYNLALPTLEQQIPQNSQADTDERVQDTRSIADVWADISSFTMPSQEDVSRLLQLADFSIDGLKALQSKDFSALQIRWNATQPNVNALETWVRNPSSKETVRIIGRTPLANLIRILNNPDEKRWDKHSQAATKAAEYARRQYEEEGNAAHKPENKPFPENTGFQDAVRQASINHANNPHAALWAVELHAFLARLTDVQSGK